jgi:hypothetical protein
MASKNNNIRANKNDVPGDLEITTGGEVDVH